MVLQIVKEYVRQFPDTSFEELKATFSRDYLQRFAQNEFLQQDIEKAKNWKEGPDLTKDWWRMIRFFFWGINIGKEEDGEIIKVTRRCNPEIKIEQMTTAPETFRLKKEIIA
jgi:hypothetical protein